MEIMKSRHFILIFLVICIPGYHQLQRIRGGSNPEFRQEFKNVTRQCMVKHKTSLLNALSLYTLGTNDKNAKCAVLCVMQHYQVMDAKGQYETKKYDVALEKMSNARFKNSFRMTLNECTKYDSEDACEKAYLFTNCLQKRGSSLPKTSPTF